jgi:hypothetical protein
LVRATAVKQRQIMHQWHLTAKNGRDLRIENL